MSAERLLRGRKHFLQSVMVSVAVSKLAETVFVSVQCDAKIVFRPITVRQFAVSRTPTSWFTRTERLHTVYTTLPAFQCAWVH